MTSALFCIIALMISIIKFLFTGWILRILIVLTLIYGLYFFHVWPFNQNVSSVHFLEDKYCSAEDAQSQAICDCILSRVSEDLSKRFTKEELIEINEDRLKSAYSLQKSLFAVRESAEKCLEDKRQKDAWGQFTRDLATLDNNFLGQVGDLINQGVDQLKEEWDSRKTEKLEIDAKY